MLTDPTDEHCSRVGHPYHEASMYIADANGETCHRRTKNEPGKDTRVLNAISDFKQNRSFKLNAQVIITQTVMVNLLTSCQSTK